MTLRKLNHLAVVVRDLDQAIATWEQALGLSCEHIEEVAEQRVKAAMFPLGDTRIELICPTDTTSGVAKFLDKRGEGLHHVCVEVDDIDAALARLKANGATLIDATPRVGVGGTRIAFIHPKTANGVLMELVEKKS